MIFKMSLSLMGNDKATLCLVDFVEAIYRPK